PADRVGRRFDGGLDGVALGGRGEHLDGRRRREPHRFFLVLEQRTEGLDGVLVHVTAALAEVAGGLRADGGALVGQGLLQGVQVVGREGGAEGQQQREGGRGGTGAEHGEDLFCGTEVLSVLECGDSSPLCLSVSCVPGPRTDQTERRRIAALQNRQDPNRTQGGE